MITSCLKKQIKGNTKLINSYYDSIVPSVANHDYILY